MTEGETQPVELAHRQILCAPDRNAARIAVSHSSARDPLTVLVAQALQFHDPLYVFTQTMLSSAQLRATFALQENNG